MKADGSCSDDPHEYEKDVVSLYRRGEYESALRITLESIDKFTHLRQLGFYWSARLHAVLGRAESAVDALKAGLADGHWWSDVLLLHSDLLGLRDQPGFRHVFVESTKRSAGACAAASSRVLVLPPEAGSAEAPLLLALHGRGVEASKFGMHWRAAGIETDVLLAVPQSTQMLADGLFCWDDSSRAQSEILAALEKVAGAYSFNRRRIILAGFGQGADLAIRLTLAGAVEGCRAFLAVGPTMLGVSADQYHARAGEGLPGSRTREVHGWLGVGMESTRRTACERFARESGSRGHSVRLSLIHGMTDEFSYAVGTRLGAEVAALLTEVS